MPRQTAAAANERDDSAERPVVIVCIVYTGSINTGPLTNTVAVIGLMVIPATDRRHTNSQKSCRVTTILTTELEASDYTEKSSPFYMFVTACTTSLLCQIAH